MNYSEELKRILMESDEYFIIGKSDGKFQLIHSNLTDPIKWLEMIEYFKNKLENKVIDSLPDPNDDLLNDNNFNPN